MAFLTELFVAFGRVVTSSLSGQLNAVLGSLASLEDEEDTEEASTSPEEPLYGALGIVARPAPAVKTGSGSGNTPDGAAEFVGARLGDREIPLAYRDLRLNAKVNPKDGEIDIVQYKGGFISLKDNDDGDGTSITIYAVRNDANGDPDKASVINIDTAVGNASVSVVHENGQSITLNKDGNITLMNKDGDSLIDISDNGITLNSAQVVSVGGTLLGGQNPVTLEFVALANLIDTHFGDLKTYLDAHTHSGVRTGPGTSGAPNTSPAPPVTVGSSLVKAAP